MRIIVFGANGPTGRRLTSQASDEGHRVTAFTRHPEVFPKRHDSVDLVGGDVFELSSVQEAVEGHDAVVSTLGVPFSRRPITVYSQGTAHIISAMQRSGVERLVCVSSGTVDPDPSQQGGLIFRKLLQPYFVNVVGRTLYEDLGRMEDVVTESQLAWTIIRPSGLFETSAVTAYELVEDHHPGRFTSRTDLADCLLKQLTDDRHVHGKLAVATVTVRPNMLKLLWNEGIKKKSGP